MLSVILLSLSLAAAAPVADEINVGDGVIVGGAVAVSGAAVLSPLMTINVGTNVSGVPLLAATPVLMTMTVGLAALGASKFVGKSFVESAKIAGYSTLAGTGAGAVVGIGVGILAGLFARAAILSTSHTTGGLGFYYGLLTGVGTFSLVTTMVTATTAGTLASFSEE